MSFLIHFKLRVSVSCYKGRLFLLGIKSFLPALCCSFFPFFLLLLSQPWGYAKTPHRAPALASSPILTEPLALRWNWYHGGYSQREGVLFNEE